VFIEIFRKLWCIVRLLFYILFSQLKHSISMKKLVKLLPVALFFLISSFSQAQTAEEIVAKYLKQTGGDKWATIKTLRMTAKVKAQGQEIPVTMLQKAPNAQKVMFIMQGKEITQMSFDGKEGWNTNFMTMKPEKMEAEDSEMMKEDQDIPDPFVDYAKKGYKITLEGAETIEGTACHKVKLTKKPVKIDGKEEENFSYYFFDKENNVPIMSRSTIKKGQGKGAVVETFMSDYQEVNGIFVPFTMEVKYNGQTGQSIVLEKVEMNVEITDKDFAFPAETPAPTKN
jgi:outer membrane lipoprotein-sorting protein